MTEKRLGRGLAALIGDALEEPSGPESIIHISIDLISPNPFQPRQDFQSPEAQRGLEELANSIREKGIIQPITVREKDGRYELVVGERRWRAAKVVGLDEITAHVLKIDDDAEMMVYALVENLQRENLNAIEEGEAYAVLSEKHRLSHARIAEAVGKSRVAITNTLRLLKLPREIKNSLRKGEITAGHARALLGLQNGRQMLKVWKRIVQRQESVRATEEIVAKLVSRQNSSGKHVVVRIPKSADIRKIEDDLVAILGTRVSIRQKGRGGLIEVEFYSNDDLDRLLELFSVLEEQSI